MPARFQLSPEIATRDEFADLLNRRNLLGVAVEVGVLRAGFSRPFLDQWIGRLMFLIDPYRRMRPDEPAGRDVDREFAVLRLARHAPRCIFVEEPDSEHIADGVVRTQGPPDFVYIDGDHSYEGAKRDMEIWWPRLASCGILAGHDFTPELPGVMQAVMEHCEQHELRCWLTHDAAFKSWYIYRDPDRHDHPLVRYESWPYEPEASGEDASLEKPLVGRT